MSTNQSIQPIKTGAALAPFEPTNIIEALKLSETLASSGLVPSSLRGKPQDVLVVMMKGRELGLAPMAALSSIHVIEGKATCSSDLLQAIIFASGKLEFFELVESTPNKATYRAKRKDSPNVVEITWTMDDARAAKLDAKDNWRKYPAAMLRARAAADLAREVAPDVTHGLYDMDEADDIRGSVRAAEVVDDGRPARPVDVEGLKAMHRAPAGAPGKPQDQRTPEPAREPRQAEIVQAAQGEQEDDPFGEEAPAATAPAASPAAVERHFPADPTLWYVKAEGGIDPEETFDLELELGTLPAAQFYNFMNTKPWKEGTRLGAYTPLQAIYGGENGGRHKLLEKAVAFARSASQPTDAMHVADYCLALMRKRWRLMEAAGLDTKVSHTPK